MNIKRVIRTTEAVLTLTALGLSGLIYDQNRNTREQQLELELQSLRNEILQKEEESLNRDLFNLIGDCVNEEVLREALGAPKITIEGCIAERVEWLEGMNRKSNEITQ